MTNKTFYAVISEYSLGDHFDTYEEAVVDAKRSTADNERPQYVVKVEARVQAPVPEAEVTQLS